jgi:hypothetical protein
MIIKKEKVRDRDTEREKMTDKNKRKTAYLLPKERDRQTDIHTDRQTERQREKQTDKNKKKDIILTT